MRQESMDALAGKHNILSVVALTQTRTGYFPNTSYHLSKTAGLFSWSKLVPAK
jgi:hypothetical protein